MAGLTTVRFFISSQSQVTDWGSNAKYAKSDARLLDIRSFFFNKRLRTLFYFVSLYEGPSNFSWWLTVSFSSSRGAKSNELFGPIQHQHCCFLFSRGCSNRICFGEIIYHLVSNCSLKTDRRWCWFIVL